MVPTTYTVSPVMGVIFLHVANLSSLTEQEVVDFFNLTVSLVRNSFSDQTNFPGSMLRSIFLQFQTLPTYSWLTASGITPDYSATYTLQQLQDVAIANFGQEAVWDCQNGALNQVW